MQATYLCQLAAWLCFAQIANSNHRPLKSQINVFSKLTSFGAEASVLWLAQPVGGGTWLPGSCCQEFDGEGSKHHRAKICGGSWRLDLPNISLKTLMTWRRSAKRSGTKSLLRCVQTWWPTTRNVWPLWLPTRVLPQSTKSYFAEGSNTYFSH